MQRISAVLAALFTAAVSSTAFGLGLGEIDMQSALNQPMQADIALTSAAGIDPGDIRVTLATREEHKKVGLRKAGVLSSFRFSVEKNAAGIPFVRVISKDAVREPFLEFLLRIEWPNGKLMRQYTVLVDPPVTMEAAPAIPAAPVASKPAARPAPQPAPRPPVARTAAPRPATVTTPSADEYGPIRRSETLWEIASSVRPGSDISMDQMMIALQRANPQAFIRGNINNLRAGVTLRVPDREEILAMSATDARVEAARQYDEWREGRDAAETEVAAPEAAEEAPQEPDAAEAVSPVETETKLQLVAPEGDAVEGEAAPGDPLDADAATEGGEGDIGQQLDLASEEVEAQRARSEELQTRVSELEQQIDTMKRLLELKDEQLAGMQQQLGLESDALDLDAVLEQMAAEGETGVTEETADGEAAPEGEEEAVAAEAELTEAADDAGETVADVADEAEVTEEPAAEEPAVPAREEPRGIVNKVMDNPVLAGLGLLVAMLLGGFLWASMRQKNNQSMFDDEPTLARYLEEEAAKSGSKPEQPVVNVKTHETADQGVVQQGSESSPIEEAEVYLAYGHVQQAESVLQAALEDRPDDVDLTVKLLEVNHAAGNAAAFERNAMTLRGLVGDDDPRWAKVAGLGKSIDPENLLYGAGAAESADDESSFDIDLSGIDEGPDAGAGEVLAGGEDEDMAEGLLDASDEVSTKLDLARAYIDMGDPEGARSILGEVMEEGNDEQKREAETLMSGLA